MDKLRLTFDDFVYPSAVKSTYSALIGIVSRDESIIVRIDVVYTISYPHSMDNRYSLQGVLFEWDRTKATTN